MDEVVNAAADNLRIDDMHVSTKKDIISVGLIRLSIRNDLMSCEIKISFSLTLFGPLHGTCTWK